MNITCLVGRLVRDPELRTAGELAIAYFGVAVNRDFKREGQPDADFISCKAFGKTAEFIEKYFTKGKEISIVGRIQTGSYEKDGRKVYTTDVVADKVGFVGSKGDSTPKAEKPTEGFTDVLDDEDLPW